MSRAFSNSIAILVAAVVALSWVAIMVTGPLTAAQSPYGVAQPFELA